MLKKDFQKEIDQALKSKPKNWRNGQFVFNYIDRKYKVARSVQFEDHVDCFFSDFYITEFIDKAYERIKNLPNVSIQG